MARKSEEAKEVDDLKAKLKKTTSERDLLIREYKNTKDSKEKLDMELKRHCNEHESEMKKMQETLASYEQSSGKGDKMIAVSCIDYAFPSALFNLSRGSLQVLSFRLIF